MGILLKRDTRDEWEPTVPIGTFDIEPCKLRGRNADAHILFVCPNGHRCGVFLGPVMEHKPSEKDPNIWEWDHNVDCPTVIPSINCIAEKDGKPTGGCGWHGHIKNGEMI